MRSALAALAWRFTQAVNTANDAVFLTFNQTRLRVVLVHQGQVVVDVFLIFNHSLHAMANDDCHLMRKGRIVRSTVWNRGGQDVTVTVFVLQPFAVERRASGGAAKEEAARLHIASRPRQITNALEAEHRVIDVERHHDAVVGRIRSGGGDP